MYSDNDSLPIFNPPTAEAKEDRQTTGQPLMQQPGKTEFDRLTISKPGNNLQQPKRLRSCTLCRQKFENDELQSTGWKWVIGLYCATCLEVVKRENTYRCRQCLVDFPSPTSSRRPLCTVCRQNDKNKARTIVQRHRHYAKERGEHPTLTPEKWLTIVQHFEGKCAYCQEQPYAELDHFVPPNKGGKTTAKNCVPACKSCNNSKDTFNPCKPPFVFNTNYLDLTQTRGMTSELFEGIERVAKYLRIPLPYNYQESREYETEQFLKLFEQRKEK